MKIVIAPDSFKESLTAMQVATAIEQGFKQSYPNAEYIKVPMADGGEGTVDSMVSATNGKKIVTMVTDPLGYPVEGFFGLLGDGKTAVIEMAAASGLHLVPAEKRNPLITSSYGSGQLVLAALDHGVEKIILGIGGSATNDGGSGMLSALGAKFIDQAGECLPPGGGALVNLAKIDLSGLDQRLAHVLITTACDVNNPLCGDNGASAIFGPQKGATPEMVTELDKALLQFGTVIEETTGRHVLTAKGAGAAGGMGAGLLGLLNAKLKPGVDIVVDALGLDDVIKNADLVITGEGKTDSQTVKGKTAIGVARVAKQHNKPVIVISGSLSKDYAVVHDHGIDAAFSSLYRYAPLSEILQDAETNLFVTARNIAGLLAISQSILGAGK